MRFALALLILCLTLVQVICTKGSWHQKNSNGAGCYIMPVNTFDLLSIHVITMITSDTFRPAKSAAPPPKVKPSRKRKVKKCETCFSDHECKEDEKVSTALYVIINSMCRNFSV